MAKAYLLENGIIEFVSKAYEYALGQVLGENTKPSNAVVEVSDLACEAALDAELGILPPGLGRAGAVLVFSGEAFRLFGIHSPTERAIANYFLTLASSHVR